MNVQSGLRTLRSNKNDPPLAVGHIATCILLRTQIYPTPCKRLCQHLFFFNSLRDCNMWTLKLKKGFTLIRQIPLHEVKSGYEIVSFPSGFLLLVS